MPNYEYDPTEYEDKGGDGGGGNYLPAGKHIVRVKDHELGESSGGYGQLEVEFEAKDGRTRKAWLIFEGPASFQLAPLFKACGWTSKIDLSKPGLIKKAIYGKDIEIVVVDETYQGKASTKVKWINKVKDGGGGYGTGSGQRAAPRDNWNGDETPPFTPDDEVPF